MRFLPRSLGGQLVLLMLGGFIIGNLFGAIGMRSQDGTLHPLAHEHALSRTLTAYRLAMQQVDGDAQWLDAFNTQVAQLWIDQQPDEIVMNAREHELAKVIGEHLANSAVKVHMPCRTVVRSNVLTKLSDSKSSVQCVEINLPLGKGRWLHTTQALPVQSLWRDSWHQLRFSLLLGIPPVLVLMYLFVKRILHPTAMLTNAAERMSRGERLDPLQIHGPEEIRAITAAFNNMHERITRFVDERTRMLAAISHDMRTPLTALELQAVMLPDSVERSEILRMLAEVRLMINQTLDFACCSTRPQASEEIDLTAMLHAICQQHVTPAHTLEVQAPAQLIYTCRAQRLRRAISNLIENSAKHATWIKICLEDNGPNGLQIAISDNGPGIPEAMLERVFEPFFQLDEVRDRDRSSSVGLGLSIVRDCIQAHGGSIQLHNQLHGGLLARIILPPPHRA